MQSFLDEIVYYTLSLIAKYGWYAVGIAIITYIFHDKLGEFWDLFQSTVDNVSGRKVLLDRERKKAWMKK